MSSSVLHDENGVEDDDNDDDEDDNEVFLRDRRRAKSLPAYPEQAEFLHTLSQSCRKRVKFADALGLNLASVRHFSAAEDIEIPSKVLSRLQSFPPQPPSQQQERELFTDLCVNFKSTTLTTERSFVPAFTMPVERRGYEARLQQGRVALEMVSVTRFDVRGLLRVVRAPDSCGGKKDVGVRYTFNDWLSFVDAQAVPATTEDGGNADWERFSFTMFIPPFLEPNSSIHFAVYLRADDGEFWDNNEGQNYTLRHHRAPPTSMATAFI